MAVLLDYHIEMALHKGWKTYTTNAAAFAELFPGVDATTLTAWRTAVVGKPPAIVRAVLLTQVPHLNRYYLDMRFMSADDMSTDEESIGEQFGLAGVTVRHLRITAKCQETFTHWDSTQPNVPWYVLAEDQQTVDGQPGGVVPSDV